MSDSNENNTAKTNATPSLLEPESRGGDTAEGGFSFQDGVIVATIPQWLAHEGFTSFIREAIGDVESRWFEPALGEIIDAIEAKNHHITPVPFWHEVERFQQMALSSDYRHFTLACTSTSEEIKAISEAMRRVRDPRSFYSGDSDVLENSTKDFVASIENKGKTKSDAEFLLSRVQISDGWTSSKDFAEGMFRQAAERWIPGFSDLPGNRVGRVFDRLLTLVRQRLNQPITRKDLESAICVVLEDDNFFADHRIRVETTTATFTGSERALRLDWNDFFGSDGRAYPLAADWESTVVEQLTATRKWIVENRNQRRLVLGGERRLSTSVAIGTQFPAVSGFNIDMEHRGQKWSTDSHAKPGDAYDISESHSGENGNELVIVIDIIRDISTAVKTACPDFGLADSAFSHFHGRDAITSDRQANAIVQSIKQSIERRLHETGAKRIHLFLACPSHLALFLGHRLNATAEIQCYEWSNATNYVPTCALRT
ncbi:MAG: SAVED domain-containing protein [Planctomycetaceae bacterium]|nr:SAVED domain-containing protein [Planctomycetales bacterium]MCB9924332.1 SAVED domain-containing protein [Planctomycetaceae bacterium]